MIKKNFSEVYPWHVPAEINEGVEVYVLDKEGLTTASVNHLEYEKVLEIIGNKENRFYFWKNEKDDAEESQLK